MSQKLTQVMEIKVNKGLYMQIIWNSMRKESRWFKRVCCSGSQPP